MSKILGELLGIDDPLFPLKLEKFERASGGSSLDVRLTAEIMAKSKQKLRELGLDPKDTTAGELYRALCNLVARHDRYLAAHLKLKDPTDVQEALPAIKSFIDQLDIPKSTWAMKPQAAKRLLKQQPPKKVMKQLGYRSVESMLKRESPLELFLGARFMESQSWQDTMIKRYESLKAADFETRDVKLLQLDINKWGTPAAEFVKSKRYNMTHLKEFGAVALLPLPVKKLEGICITMLPLLLHYINEVRTYGTYFKLQQVKSDFGVLLAKSIADDETSQANMAGHAIHWRSIHRHMSRRPASNRGIFEPHLSPEDLYWRQAEDVLYRIEPALHFWSGLDFVALQIDGHVVSFNLIDIAVGYVNHLPLGKHSTSHMQVSLWNELFTRYLGEQAFENQVLRQLGLDVDTDMNYGELAFEEMFA